MNKIYTSHGEYPGQKLVGSERYKKLYHFTSFDSFVRIWLSQKLLFGNIQRVNDLQESDFIITATNPQHLAVMQKFRELRLNYKQISLTMDYDSYLWGCMSTQMWAYYAEKSHGVCIELDFEKLKIPATCVHAPVRYKKYTNEVLLDHNISTTQDIRRFIIKHKSQIFFTKQFSWKGENEYRIVSDSDEALNISEAISCIYVTKTDTVIFELLEKLVGKDFPIKRLKFLSRKGLSIPVLTDARKDRIEHDKMSNEINQLYISEQVSEIIEKCRDDEKKSLLMETIYFKK